MPDISVTICSNKKSGIKELLQQTIEQSKLYDAIEVKRANTKIAKEDFQIIIKPDLEFYELNGNTGVSTEVVEHLIFLLAKQGYKNCVVADGEQASGTWLENRDVLVLADLLGYSYGTKNNAAYKIESLSDDLQNAGFDATSALKDEKLSSHWLSSNFRIILSKNKTDEEFYYSLCLKNLVEILPLKDKQYHYYFRLNHEEAAAAMLHRNDIDFCIIDAFESNHGIQGIRNSNSLPTRTFIAGNNVLLTDWVAALKMGLDPYVSSINSYSLKKIGLPLIYKIHGDLSVYENWQNVSKALSESTAARNKNPLVRKLSTAWLQRVDTDIFPFKNIADAQVNKFLSPLVTNIDTHPLAYASLIALNYALGNIQQFLEGWQTLFDKEKIYRRETELGFDINDYAPQDFEAIENYIAPLAQLITYSPADANGIKWRYIDGSVLFEYSRTLPYDYNFFISKVDIAQAVQYMFDNIGGARVAVKTNAKGQVIHQGERDIYLPQPNWMVMFGGKPIDVCKIETLRYTKKSQTILWRTVKSINGSAEFDDGLVSFTAKQKGITEIKLVARQKFALPLFFQVFNMDYLPAMKDALVSDSYLRFFTRTMANFEAACEGRDPRLGKIADPQWGEGQTVTHPLEAEQFKNLFAMFSGVAEKFMNTQKALVKNSLADKDESGYMHFEANQKNNDVTNKIQSFVTDVREAIEKDVKYITGIK
jgi:uncharacterized protein (DUF362 family)